MHREELDGRFERALLSSLDLRVGQITTDGESVGTTLKVLSPVQIRVDMTSTENGIRLSLSIGRKHRVKLARVDKERDLGCFEFL